MHLFKKESHYLMVTTILACGYVFFMHFLFRESWADSDAALRFVSGMEQLVPAIQRLHDDSTAYSSYWGLFFAFFWVTAPIYWLLGFLGASRLSDFRYKKLVVETTNIRIICILFIISLAMAFVFAFPILSGMYPVRQTSHFYPLLTLSWWTTSAVIYYHAQTCRVIFVKFFKK